MRLPILWRHTSCRQAHRTSVVMCAPCPSDVSEPQIDCPILSEGYSSTCIRTCRMATYKASQEPLPFPQGSHIALHPPSYPYMPCACVTGNNTGHSRIDAPCAFYCSPSGLSELLPARRISSVDNRLMAITELRNPYKEGVEGLRFVVPVS
jgi:hypothetical protein